MVDVEIISHTENVISDVYGPVRPTRIYALVDPRDFEVRYVGKTIYGIRFRLRNHIYNAVQKQAKTHVANWIRSLHSEGIRPLVEEVEIVGLDWAEREQHWIKVYREQGYALTNLTLGGEGTPGKIISAEWRALMSAKFKGRIALPETREKMRHAKLNLSDEARLNMSAAQKRRFEKAEEREKARAAKAFVSLETRAKIGAASKSRSAEQSARITEFNRTRVISDETRAKISALKMGHETSAETREKIGAAHRGRKHSDDTRANMSAAAKRISPEVRRQMAESKVGVPLSLEHRAAISAANMGRAVSEEAKAKISAANKNPSPETRARMSAAQKNKSPETIEKMRIAARARVANNPPGPASDETRAKLSAALKAHHAAKREAKMAAQAVQPDDEVQFEQLDMFA